MSADAQSSWMRRSTPWSASSSTRSPVRNVPVALRRLTGTGRPYSRATTAPCEMAEPMSLANPADRREGRRPADVDDRRD